MNEIINCIDLIKLLSNGELCSLTQIYKKLRICKLNIQKYIKIIENWGLDVYISKDGCCLNSKIEFLNENLINKYVLIGKTVVLPIIDSTNSYLIKRINKIKLGYSCVAEYQENGRGRYGRKWVTSFGSNLILSFYWFLNETKNLGGTINIVVAIAVVETLECFGIKDIKIRWPNDIYLRNKKLAGILLDTVRRKYNTIHIVIGIGINLDLSKLKASRLNNKWTDIKSLGISIDRNLLVIKLINKLYEFIKLFEHTGIDYFMHRWKSLDYLMYQPLEMIVNNKIFKGTSHGINPEGALLLKSSGKLYEFINGNIL